MSPSNRSRPPESVIQQEYYSATAAAYDSSHVDASEEPEHDIALSLLSGMSTYFGFSSFLDVGAGTGRAMLSIAASLPGATVRGVEPVEALRSVAYSKGVDRDALTDGDAGELPFADDSFDVAMMFGVLHHVREPARCIDELLRVSRRAIFLSDLNNFGCGGPVQRVVSQSLNALGLWKAAQFVRTKGRMYKISEGDGLAYSYSIYDDLPRLRRQCDAIYLTNTRGKGGRPYRDCSHIAVLAMK